MRARPGRKRICGSTADMSVGMPQLAAFGEWEAEPAELPRHHEDVLVVVELPVAVDAIRHDLDAGVADLPGNHLWVRTRSLTSTSSGRWRIASITS